MLSQITSFTLLAAIAVQGVFGSLQGSVVICLGGGHEHGPAEVAEQCELACTHDSEWPTPAASDTHNDDCDCTDIELGLIALLSTPRTADHDLQVAPAPPAEVVTVQLDRASTSLRAPPPNMKDDPGCKYRLAVIRSTRLLV